MIISLKAAMYFLSLFLLTMSLILFVTLGGVLSAYLYKLIGDSSAWESGYNSLNPFKHIDYFIILIFMITGWFLGMRKPPFYYMWESGLKGYLQRIVYFFGPALIHLIIASLFLFCGVYFFSLNFVVLAFKTLLKANYQFVFDIVSLLKINGLKLIAVLSMLYSIPVNLNLALLDLVFSFLDFVTKRYFMENILNIRFILLLYAFVILFLYFFGNYIMYFFWNIILLPLLLLY